MIGQVMVCCCQNLTAILPSGYSINQVGTGFCRSGDGPNILVGGVRKILVCPGLRLMEAVTTVGF